MRLFVNRSRSCTALAGEVCLRQEMQIVLDALNAEVNVNIVVVNVRVEVVLVVGGVVGSRQHV